MGMSADGPITWYDAMTGGNVVGSGDHLHIAPTATTSYYAEAKAAMDSLMTLNLIMLVISLHSRIR